MYLFDTNIFLEYLLDQEVRFACQRVVESLTGEKRGYISSFSLHAIEVLMWRAGKEKLLSDFVGSLMIHPFLSVYATSLEEEHEISLLAKKVGLDFDDTLQYYVAKKLGLVLVTLDRDFRRIKDVRVATPQEMLA